MNKGLLGFPLGRGLQPGTFGFPLGERIQRDGTSPPVAGYIGWWDASDVSSLTIVSSELSRWDDKSGYGRHLTQATAGLLPAYGARTIKGIVVPDWDGSNDFMSSAAPFDDSTGSAFIVAMTDATGANAGLLSAATNDGNTFYVGTDGRLKTDKTGATLLGSQGNATVTAMQAFAAAQVCAAALPAVFQRLDGVGETDDPTAFSFTQPKSLEVGRYPVSVGYWNGPIAEIILYSDPFLTSTGYQDERVEETMTYLKNKWGTP